MTFLNQSRRFLTAFTDCIPIYGKQIRKNIHFSMKTYLETRGDFMSCLNFKVSENRYTLNISFY